jgi:hypothetical protein
MNNSSKIEQIGVGVNITKVISVGVGPYIIYGTGDNWKSDTDITIGDIRSKRGGSAAFRNDASVRSDSIF